MEQKESNIDEEALGILVNCEELFEDGEEGEQQLYEKLRAIAEEAPEQRIAALVKAAPIDKTELQIKAVFRAAVYGEISLLFGDIFTNEDTERAKECTQKAFRALLEDVHEFNGFIQKGILIDTLLPLLSEISEHGWDFISIDESRLIFLLTNGHRAHKTEAEKLLRQITEKKLKKFSKRY